MIKQKKLVDQDFVWKKGFDNWVKIQDVSELGCVMVALPLDEDFPEKLPEEISFKNQNQQEKIFFIRVGLDRGAAKTTEYGPYSLEVLQRLYKEKRINGKTLVFKKGHAEWMTLGEVEGYQEVFHEAPPVMEQEEKRRYRRKPFVARMLFHTNKQVFEGVCRDISVGGMQVLVADFPAKEGEQIALNVHPENNKYHFTANGEVVRLLPGGQGFSFRFLNLSEQALSSIKNYLHEN